MIETLEDLVYSAKHMRYWHNLMIELDRLRKIEAAAERYINTLRDDHTIDGCNCAICGIIKACREL